MIIDENSQEFQFYVQKYAGKSIIIKASGAEFYSKNFHDLVRTIHILLDNDIRIYFIFGGGVQIDACYKKANGKSRKKREGVGITTREVLETGVLPAYYELVEYLQETFADIHYDTEFVLPENIPTQHVSQKELGFVGKPLSLSFDTSKSLHIIGFVGQDFYKYSNQYYNINADDIVSCIALHEKNIAEVLFITKTGGILDTNGEIISEISDIELQEMIEGVYEKAHISGGMKKKVEEILSVLTSVPQVALVTSSTIEKELFTHKGAGTLCKNNN